MTFQKKSMVLCGLAGLLLLTGCSMIQKQKQKEDQEFGLGADSGRESTYNDFKKETKDNADTDTRYLLTTDEDPSRNLR